VREGQFGKEFDDDLVQVLGYMHFSSGRPDLKLLASVNRLYGLALRSGSFPTRPHAGMPAYLTVQQWLADRLTKLQASNSAFADSHSAEAISLVWSHLLPAYLDYHRDLLFHQEPEDLFNGLFLGRAIQVVVAQPGPRTDIDRIVKDSIRQLNSFVGYRPVAVLETGTLEPYPHEWVAPLPVYIEDVGVAAGPYEKIISIALDILQKTEPSILRAASFDPAMLRELAIDPRAYDFDHPVNKRLNYQFGTWDPISADDQGYFRRFVLQQVTLNALVSRVSSEREINADELHYEAAAVLVGTMLMASAITGWGPSALDSQTSLATLQGPIAAYRDRFYADVINKVTGSHSQRLRDEEAKRRQPFGGARQNLNAHMAKKRASQLEHVQLAKLFARMGNSESAKAETDEVSVPSARIMCRIDCLLMAGRKSLRDGKLKEALQVPSDLIDLLHRGIECGAFVDPWNILGFGGNFPFFQSSDAATEDHRIAEINELLERIAAFFSRIWREASAANDSDASEEIRLRFLDLANWWHQFAAHELPDINGINLLDSYQSAELVARALRLWHAGGAAAGDVRFWGQHAELFDSPRAYALVIEALLERHDFVASLALLVHWLSEAAKTGLRSGETSFAEHAETWFYQVNGHYSPAPPAPPSDQESDEVKLDTTPIDKNAQASIDANNEANAKLWKLCKRFFDYIEANADDYWHPPEFQLAKSKSKSSDDADDEDGAFAGEGFDDEAEEGESTFGAAYDDVVFEDSTDDGYEGATFEDDTDNQDELNYESRRLNEHLSFLTSVAKMWKHTALRICADHRNEADDPIVDEKIESLQQWCVQCSQQISGCTRLINQIKDFPISRGGADPDSMARYDRKRWMKESLLERVIQASLEIGDARRMMLAAIIAFRQQRPNVDELQCQDLRESDWEVTEIFGNLLAGEHEKVSAAFEKFLPALRAEKLLYVPMARGGDPVEICHVRLRRRSLSHLMTWLPRQGLILAASRLLETARNMEHHNPVGPGAVTEFDELFQIGFTSIARSVVRSAYSFRPNNGVTEAMELEDIVERGITEPAVPRLLGLIERTIEVLLHSWLMHSRTLRLSVLELIDTPGSWNELSEFIKEYGQGVFTQTFLRLGNVRAILHQGVSTWLKQAGEQHESTVMDTILEAIDEGKLSLEKTSKWLTIILESVLDHHAEYRDYNSTTTQSDRGEMIYMFLDFLRLRVRYERVSWNLRPVFLAHEVLVRNGCQQTAQQWRRALAERVGREANTYLNELAKLQERYAMMMPTVADRLNERFLKPMSIGRMRALVRPAMKQIQADDRPVSSAFELLLQEAHLNMREPSGVGFEIPEWLQSLHEEVDQILSNRWSQIKESAFERAVPFVCLRAAEIEGQLDAFAKLTRMKNLNVKKDES
jgi:hypothetical protein